MTFGEKLLRLRREKGISQEQLAAALGVSRQAVSKWELGESLPDTEKILQLAKMFHVSTDYLLDEEKEYDTQPQPAAAPPQPAAPTHDTWGRLGKFIHAKGYIAGFIISGYGAAMLLLLRIAHFMFAQMMPEPFLDESMMPEMNAPFRAPLQITNFLSILAGVVIVGGIVLAIYLKKRANRKK